MDRGMTSGLRCLFFFAYRRGQHEGTILNRRENTISVYLILQLTVIAHSIIYFFSYSSKSLSTFRIKFCIFFVSYSELLSTLSHSHSLMFPSSTIIWFSIVTSFEISFLTLFFCIGYDLTD